MACHMFCYMSFLRAANARMPLIWRLGTEFRDFRIKIRRLAWLKTNLNSVSKIVTILPRLRCVKIHMFQTSIRNVPYWYTLFISWLLYLSVLSVYTWQETHRVVKIRERGTWFGHYKLTVNSLHSLCLQLPCHLPGDVHNRWQTNFLPRSLQVNNSFNRQSLYIVWWLIRVDFDIYVAECDVPVFRLFLYSWLSDSCIT